MKYFHITQWSISKGGATNLKFSMFQRFLCKQHSKFETHPDFFSLMQFEYYVSPSALLSVDFLKMRNICVEL